MYGKCMENFEICERMWTYDAVACENQLALKQTEIKS